MEECYNTLVEKGYENYNSSVNIRSGIFSENDFVSLFNGAFDLSFQIDREGLFDLLNKIIDKQKNIKLENSYNYMIDLFNLVQNEINDYFGTGNLEKRLSFYMLNGKINSNNEDERICTLSQIKGKGIAKCAEKASVANNILLMLHKMSLFDYEVNYLNSLLSINSSFPDGHAYLEFSRVKNNGEKVHIIYDITNPEIVIYNGQDYAYPALYQLDENEFYSFINGGFFDNTKFIASQNFDLKEKRVYSGFKQEENDKNYVDKQNKY